MPRTGGVYSPPAGTKGVPNTTIQSVPYNTLIDDLTADANAPRPVTAGGTGATSASSARTALGVEIGTNVQAFDPGLQSIAGLTTTPNQMLFTTATDAYATTALTPFARSILDDADALTARTTIGANDASNLTAGTVADARLPGSMSGKAFSGNIVVGTSTYQTDGNIVFSGGMAAHGANLAATLTAKANLSGATFSGTVTATDLVSNGDVFAGGGDILVRSNSNRHLWYQTLSGVNRGLLYHDNAGSHLSLQLYNSAGTFVRRLTFYEGDGQLYVQGYINIGAGGHMLIGDARYQSDGNIYMPIYGDWLSNVLASKITTNGRAYPRRSDGGDLNFHWSGQGGQPSWIWGGNDGANMYVYNPSNFSVNWANSAGNAIGHGQWWQNVTSARAANTSYQNTTGRPIAVTIYSVSGGGVSQDLVVSGDNANWTIVSSGIYDATSGGTSRSMGNGGFTIVPAGWYYKLLTNGGVSLVNWQELRA